ncbi:GPI-anchored protein [Stagonosporopsis vannaccii]|nr:GPI-anchored protein [Stagonosporopsis vannaccii]
MVRVYAALLALAGTVHAVSQIALFTDANCQDSYKGLEGPNGYPNGSCTDIRRSGTWGSMQVVGLDPGCAVTIYVNDPETTICGGYQEEIQLGECWNSTFVYYSIDMCDIGALLSSSSPSTSSSPSSSSSSTTGALVGGIVGGLAGLALILGLALWLLWRKKRARKAAAEQPVAYAEVESNPRRGEVDGHYPRHEMAEGKDVYAHRVAEVEGPVAELGGREILEHQGRS